MHNLSGTKHCWVIPHQPKQGTCWPLKSFLGWTQTHVLKAKVQNKDPHEVRLGWSMTGRWCTLYLGLQCRSEALHFKPTGYIQAGKSSVNTTTQTSSVSHEGYQHRTCGFNIHRGYASSAIIFTYICQYFGKNLKKLPIHYLKCRVRTHRWHIGQIWRRENLKRRGTTETLRWARKPFFSWWWLF